MQATKHTPATPLPWKLSQAFPYIVTTPEERIAEMCMASSDVRNTNAAYIAHAANAYPKLVEALRDIASDGDALSIEELLLTARAALREVGELS